MHDHSYFTLATSVTPTSPSTASGLIGGVTVAVLLIILACLVVVACVIVLVKKRSYLYAKLNALLEATQNDDSADNYNTIMDTGTMAHRYVDTGGSTMQKNSAYGSNTTTVEDNPAYAGDHEVAEDNAVYMYVDNNLYDTVGEVSHDQDDDDQYI